MILNNASVSDTSNASKAGTFTADCNKLQNNEVTLTFMMSYTKFHEICQLLKLLMLWEVLKVLRSSDDSVSAMENIQYPIRWKMVMNNE